MFFPFTTLQDTDIQLWVFEWPYVLVLWTLVTLIIGVSHWICTKDFLAHYWSKKEKCLEITRRKVIKHIKMMLGFLMIVVLALASRGESRVFWTAVWVNLCLCEIVVLLTSWFNYKKAKAAMIEEVKPESPEEVVTGDYSGDPAIDDSPYASSEE